jgi:hypothetical protein
MHLMFQEERCPVAEEVLGKLYSAHPDGLRVLVETIPPGSRAQLAVYCSRRAHLATIGRAIAATCAQGDLERVAGKFGVHLFEEARTAQPAVVVPLRGRRAVSLSRGMLRDVIADED